MLNGKLAFSHNMQQSSWFIINLSADLLTTLD